MINIFVADDHPILLNGIHSSLKDSKHWKIVGTSHQFTPECTSNLKELKVDLLILDISMPGMDSFELVPIIKEKLPDLKIIIYTMHAISRYYHHFLNLGVDGYLVKSGSRGSLIEAIEEVISGKRYFPSHILDTIKLSDQEVEENQLQFTSFEEKIIKELKELKSNSTIAKNLDCSLEKVLTTRKNLLVKTGALNTDELLKYS